MRRRAPVVGIAALAAALALAPAPASAQEAYPSCTPEDQPGVVIIPNDGIVAGRDLHFTPIVGPDAAHAFSEGGRNFTYALAAPSTVTAEPDDDSGSAVLRAAQPGPLAMTIGWDHKVTKPNRPFCRATGTITLAVLPLRLPAVRREVAELPVAIGPVVSWPCIDPKRVTAAPATIVVRYERGLGKVPGAGSPSSTMTLKSPCDETVAIKGSFEGVSKTVPGVMRLFAGVFRRDPNRVGVAIYPARAGDMRMLVEIRWGDSEVFRHDYAIVSAGKRREEKGTTPVFLTTGPAAAAAAARRYARQRRGAAYVSAEQRAAERSPRAYSYKISGSFTTQWTGALGAAGDAGCAFVRESGADTATFASTSHGKIQRSYTETRECEPMRTARKLTCPLTGSFRNEEYTASVVPDGALTFDGRRVHGARLLLQLQIVSPGGCPGWGGLIQAATLDAPAKGVARLHPGRSVRVALARTIDCRDEVAATVEPSACTARVAATVVVRRLR